MDTDKQQEIRRVYGKPFVKGVSGNPLGRPKKGQTITDLLAEYLDQKDEVENITLKQKLVKRVVTKAINGDITAIKLIWAYMDGFPTQRTEVKNTEPFTIIVSGKGYRNPKAESLF